MKILSTSEIKCVNGADDYGDSQMCSRNQPYGFIQYSNAYTDQINQAAQRPYDPPLESTLPGKLDIGLAIAGAVYILYQRFW